MRRSQKTSARSPQTPIGASTDRALIRELFIERVPLYSLVDALRLARTTQTEVDAAIAAGDLD